MQGLAGTVLNSVRRKCLASRSLGQGGTLPNGMPPRPAVPPQTLRVGRRRPPEPQPEPEPEPEPDPEPEARAYCTSILWGRSCRWGDTCDYGHDVPEHLLAAQV